MINEKNKSKGSLKPSTLKVFLQVFGSDICQPEIEQLKNGATVAIERENFEGQFYLNTDGIISVKFFSGHPLLQYYGPMGVWDLSTANLKRHLQRISNIQSCIQLSAKA